MATVRTSSLGQACFCLTGGDAEEVVLSASGRPPGSAPLRPRSQIPTDAAAAMGSTARRLQVPQGRLPARKVPCPVRVLRAREPAAGTLLAGCPEERPLLREASVDDSEASRTWDSPELGLGLSAVLSCVCLTIPRSPVCHLCPRACCHRYACHLSALHEKLFPWLRNDAVARAEMRKELFHHSSGTRTSHQIFLRRMSTSVPVRIGNLCPLDALPLKHLYCP